MKPLGIQIHSVRELAEKDFIGTIRQLAEIGYKGIECARLYDYSPGELRKALDDLGMVCIGRHGSVPAPDNVNEIVDVAKTLGADVCISSLDPQHFESADKIKAAAERFRQGRELLRPHGVSMAYHNHFWEWNLVDGILGYEMFLELAGDMALELDTYWTAVGQVQFGVADTVEIIRRHRKQIPLLHLKDGPLTKGEPRAANVAVGKGKMDIPACINAADPQVLQWLIVEFDQCKSDILQAVRDSYEYLTTNGLAKGSK